jgi:hypothetical protein
VGYGSENVWLIHCFYYYSSAGRTQSVDSAARNADKIERVTEGGHEERKGKEIKKVQNWRRKPGQ